MKKVEKRTYSDAFKLEVVRDYYRNQLGVRTTAKYGLPSKNYITNWERYLKNKGLLLRTLLSP